MSPETRVLVADDSKGLALRIKGLVGDGAGVDIYACVDPGLLTQAAREDGPFDVIIAGPALATASGLEILGSQHRDDPSTYLLLAFGSSGFDCTSLVRTGASDLVVDLDDDPILLDAVLRAASWSRAWRDAVGSPTRGEGPQRGRILTVCSATGGCGKTFFSTNLATYLAHNSGGRVALVDLDLQFGEVGPTLRLRPEAALPDLMDSGLLEPRADDVNAFGELESYLTESDDGVWVLAAPKDPVDADRVKPNEVARILELLASRFDYVVVDNPTGLTELVLAALDVSERLFVMASLDVMSVRNLRVFLQTLDRLNIAADHVSLVLNKAEKGLGITVEDVMRVFDDGFDTVVPFAREVPRSMNEGVPLLESHPGTDVARILADEFARYLPDDRRERVRQERSGDRGTIRRFIARRARGRRVA